MGRLDHRLRRLTQQVKESLPARQQARLARMSDEDLHAEMVRLSLLAGMPEELAQGRPDAVLAWGKEYMRQVKETLSEEEWNEISRPEPFRAGRRYP